MQHVSSLCLQHGHEILNADALLDRG